ncbi:phosphate ABC transporter substrate-binding/OmpA family protein [Zooshikella ganghwensis]|uniref:Nitrate ABC transporter substrate-binding protein n=1 Tax=Zooshikella ganghwensis TaxID=202772 RepID=A0A4P9VT60_9GAMM|nr:phosphate ABC transporter substrate-binding/OmpA family protein [Zooshikella ganghwensis]RDH46049.1 nitrate ABC transporter substrate-binding protein [Zooshikella ganghwensis]
MSKHVKATIFLIILGLVVMGITSLIKPWFSEWEQKTTSDARITKGKISIAVDDWVGYFPLCSPHIKSRLRQEGYRLNCINDKADYAQRMKGLAKGKLDFAVATVDAYVLTGSETNYPGTIINVIDESKGGDALVAREDTLASLDELKAKNNIRIAFTPDSPSDHLLKALSVHFDIPHLRQRGNWAVTAEGSAQALEKLLEGDVDAAVLWEPHVSKALKEDGIIRILGSDQTAQLIVDVLLVNRELSKDQPEKVKLFLQAYYQTQKYYRDNPKQLQKDLKKTLRLDDDEISTVLDGVRWISLADNARIWFGTHAQGYANETLINTIEGTIGILREYGYVTHNPLPGEDPYRITNSQFVASLFDQFSQQGQLDQVSQSTVALDFKALTDKQWDRLVDVGTLKVRPVVFSSGTDQLTLEGKEQLDRAAENLKHYPRFRIEVRGHTSTRGDKDANLRLSQERADAVRRYLLITHAIAEHRIRAKGFGGTKPLAKRSGESSRAYYYRLPRVELVLVGENF